MQRALEPTADSAWVLHEHGYDPLREGDIESRFAIGNGFLGVRGARAVSRGPMWVSWIRTFNWASRPRTYIAGLFDTPNIEPPVPALMPAADWLRVRVRLNDDPLQLRSGHMLSHRRTLDMRRGLMIVDWRQQNPAGIVVRVRSLRLVSQAERAIGLQLLALEVDQDNVEVTLKAEFDQAGFGLDVVHLEPNLGVWRTEQSGKSLAMANAAEVQLDAGDLVANTCEPLASTWSWKSVPGQVVCFERLVAVVRGDDRHVDSGAAAQEALGRAHRLGWRRVLEAHEAAWAARWQCSDVEVEGDDSAQQALRFAVYHLNSAANPTDERVSIGARALTGDSYLGHVFWDTEIYLLPFYTATWPEAARALLMYRYHTLDGARAKATRMGWSGAMYAWESADTGDETTPDQILGADGLPVDVLCGKQEQHISADVAHAVWHYWLARGDADFLCNAGAEILLETARFWASRAQPEGDGYRHIRGVIGPDEYHEQIDDSAFTNLMARWNIRRALDAAALLRERWPEHWVRLAGRLGLTDSELEQWRVAAETLVTGYDPATGIFEQFTGFFGLDDVDLEQYSGRAATMAEVLGRERTTRSKLLKQADVVTLLALLPEEFDPATTAINFRYYEPLCAHDSSLSRTMHALTAARLGDPDLALRYFRDSAAIDLADTAGGSAGGVHIAALGGLWQVAVLGFAGVSWNGDSLSFAPLLPAAWRSLAFFLQWRGRRLRIRIEQSGHILNAMLQEGADLTIDVRGQSYELGLGRLVRVVAGS
jgi:trehalose/maltose hydrolase-like predicted phosphorylase